MYRNRSGKGWFWFLLMSICLGAIGFGGYRLYKKQFFVSIDIASLERRYEKLVELCKKKKSEERVVSHGDTSTSVNWIDVQKQTQSGVVKIFGSVSEFNWLEPYRTPNQGEAQGSGFFINVDGDIVTNYHVINQAKTIEIQIPALGQERLEVEVIGACPERDVALLKLKKKAKKKIQKVFGKDIPFLQFGTSDVIQRGEAVLNLGYPLGVHGMKSTQGIVSGRERVPTVNMSCIQTSAAINPGNSGGPALNFKGEVIGINFAIPAKSQNMTFIIPIDDVKSALEDLYKVKLLRKPMIGCLLEAANDDLIDYLGNPGDGGYYISKVFQSTILKKIGIHDGDMIYEVNGHRVDKHGDVTVSWSEDKVSLGDLLSRYNVGDKVSMLVYRRGEKMEFNFELEPRYLLPIRMIYPEYEKIEYDLIAGIVVMELSVNHMLILGGASSLAQFQNPEKQYESAVVISHVQPTSIAQKLRLLAPGMIVEEINGEKISTLEDFREAVRKSKESRYLTVKTDDYRFVAFSVENILKDEDRLSSMYFFDKSKLIDEIK
jgi:serine protease Do